MNSTFIDRKIKEMKLNFNRYISHAYNFNFNFIDLLFTFFSILLACEFIQLIATALQTITISDAMILTEVKDKRAEGLEDFKVVLLVMAFNTALLGFIYNVRRHLSEDYCKESKEQLIKAFDNLTPKADEGISNDRLRWLTTARMIKTSELLSSKIMMRSHKDSYREEKQYWRIKFNDLLNGLPSDFYADDPKHMIMCKGDERQPIEESSLVVIYTFLQWPDDYSDPLEQLRFSDEDIYKMQTRGPRGLGQLLAANRALRKKK